MTNAHIAKWLPCLDAFAGIKKRQRLGLCCKSHRWPVVTEIACTMPAEHTQSSADFAFRLLNYTAEKGCKSVVLDSRTDYPATLGNKQHQMWSQAKVKKKNKQAEWRDIFPCPRTYSGMYSILVLTFVDRTFGQSVIELVLSRKPVCSSRAYQEQQQQSRVGEMTHFQKYFHIFFENFIYLHSVSWLYLSFPPSGPS